MRLFTKKVLLVCIVFVFFLTETFSESQGQKDKTNQGKNHKDSNVPKTQKTHYDHKVKTNKPQKVVKDQNTVKEASTSKQKGCKVRQETQLMHTVKQFKVTTPLMNSYKRVTLPLTTRQQKEHKFVTELRKLDETKPKKTTIGRQSQVQKDYTKRVMLSSTQKISKLQKRTLPQNQEALSTQKIKVASMKNVKVTPIQNTGFMSTRDVRLTSTQHPKVTTVQDVKLSSTQHPKVMTVRNVKLTLTQHPKVMTVPNVKLTSTQHPEVMPVQNIKLTSTQHPKVMTVRNVKLTSTQHSKVLTVGNVKLTPQHPKVMPVQNTKSTTHYPKVMTVQNVKLTSTQHPKVMTVQNVKLTSTQHPKVITVQNVNLTSTQHPKVMPVQNMKSTTHNPKVMTVQNVKLTSTHNPKVMTMRNVKQTSTQNPTQNVLVTLAQNLKLKTARNVKLTSTNNQEMMLTQNTKLTSTHNPAVMSTQNVRLSSTILKVLSSHNLKLLTQTSKAVSRDNAKATSTPNPKFMSTLNQNMISTPNQKLASSQNPELMSTINKVTSSLHQKAMSTKDLISGSTGNPKVMSTQNHKVMPTKDLILTSTQNHKVMSTKNLILTSTQNQKVIPTQNSILMSTQHLEQTQINKERPTQIKKGISTQMVKNPDLTTKQTIRPTDIQEIIRKEQQSQGNRRINQQYMDVQTPNVMQRQNVPFPQRQNDPMLQRQNDPFLQRQNDPILPRQNDPFLQRQNEPIMQKQMYNYMVTNEPPIHHKKHHHRHHRHHHRHHHTNGNVGEQNNFPELGQNQQVQGNHHTRSHHHHRHRMHKHRHEYLRNENQFNMANDGNVNFNRQMMRNILPERPFARIRVTNSPINIFKTIMPIKTVDELNGGVNPVTAVPKKKRTVKFKTKLASSTTTHAQTSTIQKSTENIHHDHKNKSSESFSFRGLSKTLMDNIYDKTFGRFLKKKPSSTVKKTHDAEFCRMCKSHITISNSHQRVIISTPNPITWQPTLSTAALTSVHNTKPHSATIKDDLSVAISSGTNTHTKIPLVTKMLTITPSTPESTIIHKSALENTVTLLPNHKSDTTKHINVNIKNFTSAIENKPTVTSHVVPTTTTASLTSKHPHVSDRNETININTMHTTTHIDKLQNVTSNDGTASIKREKHNFINMTSINDNANQKVTTHDNVKAYPEHKLIKQTTDSSKDNHTDTERFVMHTKASKHGEIHKETTTVHHITKSDVTNKECLDNKVNEHRNLDQSTTHSYNSYHTLQSHSDKFTNHRHEHNYNINCHKNNTDFIHNVVQPPTDAHLHETEKNIVPDDFTTRRNVHVVDNIKSTTFSTIDNLHYHENITTAQYDYESNDFTTTTSDAIFMTTNTEPTTLDAVTTTKKDYFDETTQIMTTTEDYLSYKRRQRSTTEYNGYGRTTSSYYSRLRQLFSTSTDSTTDNAYTTVTTEGSYTTATADETSTVRTTTGMQWTEKFPEKVVTPEDKLLNEHELEDHKKREKSKDRDDVSPKSKKVKRSRRRHRSRHHSIVQDTTPMLYSVEEISDHNIEKDKLEHGGNDVKDNLEQDGNDVKGNLEHGGNDIKDNLEHGGNDIKDNLEEGGNEVKDNMEHGSNDGKDELDHNGKLQKAWSFFYNGWLQKVIDTVKNMTHYICKRLRSTVWRVIRKKNGAYSGKHVADEDDQHQRHSIIENEFENELMESQQERNLLHDDGPIVGIEQDSISSQHKNHFAESHHRRTSLHQHKSITESHQDLSLQNEKRLSKSQKKSISLRHNELVDESQQKDNSIQDEEPSQRSTSPQHNELIDGSQQKDNSVQGEEPSQSHQRSTSPQHNELID